MKTLADLVGDSPPDPIGKNLARTAVRLLRGSKLVIPEGVVQELEQFEVELIAKTNEALETGIQVRRQAVQTEMARDEIQIVELTIVCEKAKRGLPFI